VPNEHATRPEHPREFRDHRAIVGRVGEKPERCEQVEDCVELSGPFRRQAAHVPAVIAQPLAHSPRPGAREKLGGQIEAVDIEAGFRQQVRMAPLAARNIEDARAVWQPENLEQAGDLVSIALEREQWLVFSQVESVEVVLPPIVRSTQKKTGSR